MGIASGSRRPVNISWRRNIQLLRADALRRDGCQRLVGGLRRARRDLRRADHPLRAGVTEAGAVNGPHRLTSYPGAGRGDLLGGGPALMARAA